MRIAILSSGGVSRDGQTGVLPWLIWLIERLARSGDDVHVFLMHQEERSGHWPLLGAQIHNAGHSPLCMMSQVIAEHRRVSFDILDAMWVAPSGVIAAFLGKLLGLPMLLHLPGGDLVNMPDIAYGGRLRPKSRLYAKIAVAGATRVVAPSNFMVKQARALGIDVESAAFGVSRDAWPPAAPRRRTPGAAVQLLHIASLNLVKDQETLLNTMVRLRDMGLVFQLNIIGEDTLNGMIQNRARTLGLEGIVQFHGFLPNSALRSWVDKADLLIVSSRHEAGPVVALEAAMAGVPTVGTKVGHLADWSEDGAALVASVGDSETLAQNILYLSTHEDERLSLAGRAQQKALVDDADATTGHLRRLYVDMLQERQAG